MPEQFAGSYVSANFFRMLGVTPQLGRSFGADEERLDNFAIGRLADGVTVEQARAELKNIGAEPARRYLTQQGSGAVCRSL